MTGKHFDRTLTTALCLSVVLLVSANNTKAVDPLSGQALATHCMSAATTPSLSYCTAYFQGVLDTLASRAQAHQSGTYCVPSDLTTSNLIGLFLSESRLYPEVLETPANRLIFGMLLKFFPCRPA